MDKKDEQPRNRYQDLNEKCFSWQRDAQHLKLALYKIPDIVDRQKEIDREFDLIHSKFDQKMDKLIETVERLTTAIAVMAEKTEAQNREFERVEGVTRALREKVTQVEDKLNNAMIDMAKISTNQNNAFAIAGKILPYIALIISIAVSLYKVNVG